MKPLDLRLIREVKAARWFIAGAVALALFGLLGTVGLAWMIAIVVNDLFAFSKSPTLAAVLTLAAFGGMKAVLIWLNDYLAISAANRIKKDLRNRFLDQIDRSSSQWLADQSSTELALLFGRGLDSLDAYFSKFVPQLFHAAIATPVLVAIAYSVDFTSGLIFSITLPLIPIFMIFIGWATRAEQKKQLAALTNLSNRFAQVLRGMSTLRIFGREQKQQELLAQSNEMYRSKTMRVLRISFLSGFALELAASLSVALVAVAIGFRLVWGELDLLPGLFILLLAPEVYLPLRNVGASFHASSEGAVAVDRIFNLLDSGDKKNEVTLPQTVDFAPGISLITGPSGVGKSTVLRNFFEANRNKSVFMDQKHQAWPASVLENIVGPGNHVSNDLLQIAVSAAQLDDLKLDYQVVESGSNLSGGQLQRLSLARAVYRFLVTEAEILILDEPTSAQDEHRCSQIILKLTELTRTGSLIVVSHQSQWQKVADSRIELANV